MREAVLACDAVMTEGGAETRRILSCLAKITVRCSCKGRVSSATAVLACDVGGGPRDAGVLAFDARRTIFWRITARYAEVRAGWALLTYAAGNRADFRAVLAAAARHTVAGRCETLLGRILPGTTVNARGGRHHVGVLASNTLCAAVCIALRLRKLSS
jgi:hypothetical protein